MTAPDIKTKADALSYFGGNGAELARLLGITRSAVSLWPYRLPQKTIDWIVGAIARRDAERAAESQSGDA